MRSTAGSDLVHRYIFQHTKYGIIEISDYNEDINLSKGNYVTLKSTTEEDPTEGSYTISSITYMFDDVNKMKIFFVFLNDDHQQFRNLLKEMMDR